MNTVIEQINSIGQWFVEFAGPMLLQSSVLILILLVVDFALRKKVRAVFRYWIWMLVLVKLVLPTSLSSPVSLGYWLADKLPALEIRPSGMEPDMVEPAPTILPPVIDLTNIDVSSYAQPVEPVLPVPGPVAFKPTGPPEAQVTPVKWQGVAFLAWLAVAAAMGLLLLQRALFVRGLVAQARNANKPMSQTLEECCRCIGVRRKVGLKVSPNATTPAVCGLFRPVILVPQNLRSSLESRHLRTVLLHELAHIKRGDLWVNLAQTALQIAYFYNPLLWFANAIIRRVREQAVDEAVLVAMGEKAQQYPQILVDVAKLSFKRPALSLRLIGVVESKSALTARIKHILSRPMPKSAKLGIVGVLAVIIAAAILLPMAEAERNQKLLRGIDEKLKVTDKAGELTINSIYMPSPNGKSFMGTNKVTMCVDVTNNSEKDIYLGLEYYTDSGTIAKVFSPGASSLAQIGKVPANWQGKLEYPIRYSRFAKGGYVKITLARCAVKENMKETKLAFLPTDSETLYKKKYNIVPIDDTQPDAGVLTDSSFTATLANGVTVELVGLTHHVLAPYENAEPLTWWRPDGSKSTISPYWRLGRSWLVSSDETCYDVLLNVQGAEHYGLRGETALARAHIPHLNPLDVDGKRMESFDKRVIICSFKKNQDKGIIRVGIASGPWQEIESWKYRWASGEPHNVAVKSESALVLEWPRQHGNSVVVEITHKYTDEDRQLLVIDKDGKTHSAQSRAGVGTGVGLIRDIYRFDNLDRKDMGTLKFQTRPYHWVQFNNVSLKPGVKTNEQVEVEQGNKSSESKDAEDYEKMPSDSVLVRVVDTKGRIIPIKDVPYTRIYYRDATTGNPTGWQIDLQIEKALSDGSLLVNHRDVLVRKFLGMNRETKRNDYTISMCFQPEEGPVFSATMLYPQKATETLSFVVPPRTKVAGVGNVAPDELAGRVVDVDGNPIAGATISVYPDHRGLENHPFNTDSKGAFRMPGFGDRWCLYVKVEKDGYATQWLTDFEIGKNFIVTMDQSTVLQGIFVNDSGEQAGRTQITLAKYKLTMQPRRGNSVGPITITHETDDKGSYDFPIEPGLYDVKVASESGLFNRSRVFIGAGQIVSLPSTLEPGIRFKVRVVDSLTNKPIEDVNLWIDSHTTGRVDMKEGSQKTTNSEGLAVWESLMPGNTSFSIMKKGYCRWWSDALLKRFGTFKSVIYPGGYNWQRNIDSLRFDLIADMPVVVIKMEKGVKLSGRVLSPEGKPVANAWVDITPADGPHTLTGDSRYRMITDEDGRFGIEEKYYRGYVPAGKHVLYNLCAYDAEDRWANAVSKPFASKPGDKFEFTLRMTKGGSVSGRVVDSEGNPVPNIEVEAIAQDNLDSPYFKPRSLTDENGAFTLGPMREGRYRIQPDTMKGVNIARSPTQEKTEVRVVDGEVTSVKDLVFRTHLGNVMWDDRWPK